MVKLKEELRAEFKQELKAFKDTVERDLRNEIRELRSEQRATIQSIEFAQETIEDLKKKLEAVESVNAQQKAENALLQAKCMELETKNAALEQWLVLAEQYSRNANLEIRGVIKQDGESVAHLVSMLGEAIKEPITESDIETCHRVPTRNSDETNIVVQFKSRSKRDTALRKARKMRLTNKDVGLEDTAPIYINEHLCPALKKLLGMAVKRKHEYKWKSVWTSNGKICARQSDNSEVVLIRSESDLSKITSTVSQTPE